MEEMTYGSSVVKVVKFLLSNKDRWITDYEITDFAPQFGERIINELLASGVVSSTKDGIYFSDNKLNALKMYLRKLGVKIE